ncbi:MAG: Methionine import ATP-binding protein MetN [Syntrophus sp. PtaB.Bin001]|nr:MAG: Methionine import ATP-binding protein MetN [Syntrophus sp. PtaB.Bin001]
MEKKLDATVLTQNPQIILLDELTSSLDPSVQRLLAELIFELSQAGKTIMISTRDLTLVNGFQLTVAVISEDQTMEKTGFTGEELQDEDLLHPRAHALSSSRKEN